MKIQIITQVVGQLAAGGRRQLCWEEECLGVRDSLSNLATEQRCLRNNLQIDESVESSIDLHEDANLSRGEDFLKYWDVPLPCLGNLDQSVHPSLHHRA